jgi:hypothetical protein
MNAETALEERGYADTEVFTLPMAAKVWGLRLVAARRLKLEPDETYVNLYGKTSARYTRESVIRYYDDKRVVRARYRANGPRDWPSVFEEEHGTPERAIPAAAQAMDELFHYAGTAGDTTRRRVYRLLVPFTRFLYERGHCVRVVRHRPDCKVCGGRGCVDCPGECFGFVFHVGHTYRWRLPTSECEWVQEFEDGEWADDREIPSGIHFPKHYALIEWVMQGCQTAHD